MQGTSLETQLGLVRMYSAVAGSLLDALLRTDRQRDHLERVVADLKSKLALEVSNHACLNHKALQVPLPYKFHAAILL